jgi:hypothetical protein
MAVDWFVLIKTSLVRATNDTENLIREVALPPNNSNCKLEIQPERNRKKKKIAGTHSWQV